MALNDLGIEVPAATDMFDPDGDMRELGGSLAGRIIVPVANTTERDSLAVALSPTASEPLFVFRADALDAPVEYTTDGSTWMSPMAVPHMRRSQAADQTLSTSTFTALVFGTEDDADPTGTITYSNGTFTVGRAGLYLMTCSVGFDASSTGTRQLELRLNDVTIRYGLEPSPAGGIPARFAIPATVARLEENDQIKFNGYQSSGGNLNTESGAYTSMSISRISG